MERLNASTFNQLQKEAEQGNPQAQYALGGAYYNGNGTARNPVEGARWLLKAAENGYAPAQCDLGVMYEKGARVEQSYKDTLKWYRTAAEQGDALAQHEIMLRLINGSVSPQLTGTRVRSRIDPLLKSA